MGLPRNGFRTGYLKQARYSWAYFMSCDLFIENSSEHAKFLPTFNEKTVF